MSRVMGGRPPTRSGADRLRSRSATASAFPFCTVGRGNPGLCLCHPKLVFCAGAVTQQGMAGDHSDSSVQRGGNPPWQAKTLWIAAGLSLLGLILWVAIPGNGPPPPVPSTQSGLAEASGEAVASSVYSAQGSPALFRLGLSYIAGFFLGYGLRRFVKMTILLSLVACAAVFLMRKAGWIDLDWGSIESHLNDSFAWLKGQAEALKVFVTGYVPSAAAAGAGLIIGGRWR